MGLFYEFLYFNGKLLKGIIVVQSFHSQTLTKLIAIYIEH